VSDQSAQLRLTLDVPLHANTYCYSSDPNLSDVCLDTGTVLEFDGETDSGFFNHDETIAVARVVSGPQSVYVGQNRLWINWGSAVKAATAQSVADAVAWFARRLIAHRDGVRDGYWTRETDFAEAITFTMNARTAADYVLEDGSKSKCCKLQATSGVNCWVDQMLDCDECGKWYLRSELAVTSLSNGTQLIICGPCQDREA
jgi:hypothetical protein